MGIGFWELYSEIDREAGKLESSIREFRQDAEAAQQVLRRRIVELETQVGRLEMNLDEAEELAK